MNSSKSLLITILFVSAYLFAHAQNDWVFEKEKNGITVYSRMIENSPFKEFKTILKVAHVPYNAVVGQLNDVDTHSEVFHTIEKATLTENTPRHYKIFSLLDLPWPMNDRSMWLDNIVTHSNEGKDIKIDIDCINDKQFTQDGYMHIENCNGSWIIKSLGEDKSYIEYQFFLDLGGNAPAKIVNYKSVEENYKTVKSVVDRSNLDQYKNYVLE